VNRVGEHPSANGPLAPRWLAWTLDEARAGATSVAHVSLENAGTATWRSQGADGIQVSFHWLDRLDNPIVWDGPRTPLPHPLAPGERVELAIPVTAPRVPGPYRLAFDLVEEHRFWFEEIGCSPLHIDVEVAPRISERRLGVRIHGGENAVTAAALAALDEPVVDTDAVALAYLVAGAAPEPGWSRLVLDAHAEGWSAVGTAIVPRGRDRALSAWNVDGGRNPRFAHPLLLPSLLDGLEPTEHLGLPAYDGPDGLFDGRASITLPPRSDRRRR
jgi:hypothetical protein